MLAPALAESEAVNKVKVVRSSFCTVFLAG
jgi:hypothetical protein